SCGFHPFSDYDVFDQALNLPENKNNFICCSRLFRYSPKNSPDLVENMTLNRKLFLQQFKTSR
ncbi:MAG: hypothetical protein KDJ99_07800, partial [Candidatus Competibacteraceae bacterium]|nr:hypothetical protein [Candidatus Competibacteraceae bacterium]